MDEIKKTEDEWKNDLTPAEYDVLRNKGTEAPFSGEYVHNKEAGTYICKACGNELFSSKTKFDSATGWPSFYDVIEQGNVRLEHDPSYGMNRTEVLCARCGSHLGHVFDDGPEQMPDGSKATGKRYCINSICLNFKEGDV